jgi:hypothetical protein
MLQLVNKTPFAATFAVFPDREGIDTVYVIVKATVSLLPRLALAPVQIPPVLADGYFGDPENSSLEFVSDMHIGKPGTDVLVVGRARPPGGQPTTEMLVTVSVAERSKTIQVFGDRTWQKDGSLTAPAEFTEMPLVWERAYGGIHVTPDRTLAEERNPVGVGFLGEREPEELEGTLAPNLVDAAAPLQRLGDISPPACFAPISPAWLPRRAFAGTYDASWQRKRAPYLPSDFDLRFCQCAAPELAFDRFLGGTEPVTVRGMTENQEIAFAVPTVHPIVEIIVAGKPGQPACELETLLIRPDEHQATLTWRAALPCDRQVLKVQTISVKLRRNDGAV